MGGRCETYSICVHTPSYLPPSPTRHLPSPREPRHLVITPPQVWDRNFQLAFWSASIYLPILIYDNPTNPFVGWSYVAVCHTGLQPRGRADPGRSATHTLAPCLGQVLCAAVGALGGVLVALSIKYTDSILKTIATTGN